MIHPSSYVSSKAKIHESAVIGPWCVIEDDAEISEGVILDCRVHVFGGVRLGANTRVFDGAVVGGDPQDLKYNGEATRLEVGENCKIREYATVNRGCGENGVTKIGDSVLLMAYSHIGHDCILEEGAVIANRVQLGGHVRVGCFATIGGGTLVQQFSRIGAYSFAGGTLKIDRDVPPAVRALGDPARFAGLNLHALRKHQFSEERIAALENSYRKLYKNNLPLEDVAKKFAKGEFDCDSLISKFFEDWKGQIIR